LLREIFWFPAPDFTKTSWRERPTFLWFGGPDDTAADLNRAITKESLFGAPDIKEKFILYY
jgi:hypothetical protein